MVLNDSLFLEKYITTDKKGNEKIIDNFQTARTKLLPFTLNPDSGSVYDGSCGLNGVAGEFIRIITNSHVEPINSPLEAEELLKTELKGKYKMSAEDIERFCKVFCDIMFENDTLNVTDLSFYSFVPMKFFDEVSRANKRYDKYRSGQPKIADYYVSIASEFNEDLSTTDKDLFTEVICNCLQKDDGVKSMSPRDDYFVLPFIKASFKNDLHWLLKQNNTVIVRCLPLLLHFYACYSVIQTLVFMNKRNWGCPIDRPKIMTYMLSSEKASKENEAVKQGWSSADVLPESFLSKMSSYSQALDILNLLFEEEEKLLTYQEIIEKFKTLPFDENAKCVCERVLNKYQICKRYTLSERTTETGELPPEIDTTVSSFDEFVDKLLKLCISLQSKDYPRMKQALYSLVNIKLLSYRKEYKVLALDEYTLLFLIAMVAKDERIRLEELFRRFENYGVRFSYYTKNAISDFLVKLNLLERKSDSGDAQYVRVIL